MTAQHSDAQSGKSGCRHLLSVATLVLAMSTTSGCQAIFGVMSILDHVDKRLNPNHQRYHYNSATGVWTPRATATGSYKVRAQPVVTNSLLYNAYFAGISDQQDGPLRAGAIYVVSTEPTSEPDTIRAHVAVNVYEALRDVEPPMGSYSAIVDVSCEQKSVSIVSWRRYGDTNLNGDAYESQEVDPPLVLSLKDRKQIDPLLEVARHSCTSRRE